MQYNPETDHRRSIRLRDYDYSGAGAYFITICTQGRECLFGDIGNGEMLLNDAGQMVEKWWQELPARFPNVRLDEYVIMPNHLHGIVVLTDRRGEPCVRPSLKGAYNHQNQGDHKDRPYGTIEDSLGRIIQAFKSLTTVAYIRGVNNHNWPAFPGRLWQRNYHERIIRNDPELAAIREYIATNPQRWVDDEENPTNIP